ncbi:MAG TPA: hypothetical protein VGH89_20190 [Pseudonocardia sp.]
MGARIVVVFGLGAALIAVLGYLWASQPVPKRLDPLAVPTFEDKAAHAGRSTMVPRPTLLPTDCTDLLPGQPDMAALLGGPTGSVRVHSVIGVAAPSVGQLERLTCLYTQPGRPAPSVTVIIGVFADPTSAARQRDRNISAEGGDTRASAPAPLGAANATLLTEPARRLLMLAYDRYTVTAGLANGVLPDAEAGPMLTDLTQRMLPALTPPSQPRH